MDNIRYLSDNTLLPFRIAISLRSSSLNEGDMSSNDEDNKKNRQNFFKQLNIENRIIIHSRQVHSRRIIKADQYIMTDADGLITDNDDHALFILTADCFNIFFVTENNSKFGIVHAGWKGILNGVVEEMRHYLKGETDVIIGQGICSEHFEVGKEVQGYFEDKYSDKYTVKSDDKISIDLRRIIYDSLKSYANINHINQCNVCNNNDLFSYRMGDTLKRNLSIIWREHD